MYRKILILSINLLTLSLMTKAILLIVFSALFTLLTFFARPFLLKQMNLLEFYSNLSAFLTIYSGSLYISEIGDLLKAIAFLCIILINVLFGLFWIFSFFEIVFYVHSNFFAKYNYFD